MRARETCIWSRFYSCLGRERLSRARREDGGAVAEARADLDDAVRGRDLRPRQPPVLDGRVRDDHRRAAEDSLHPPEGHLDHVKFDKNALNFAKTAETI